jgi:drug/metabolite transporter (DMT)-like permease
LVTAALVLLFEDAHVDWSGEFVFALIWLVLVLSLGAVSLLYVLIRRGAAAQVASLFFLVPPCTALIAWPLFGETLGPVAMIGMVLTATGVALASRRRPGSGYGDKDRHGSGSRSSRGGGE